MRGACGRLFAFWALAMLAQAPAHAECGSAWPARTLSFERAVDGDTLRLSDGRSLRVVGIDTPELGRDGEPDQPGARAALSYTSAFLERHGPQLQVSLAEDPEDGHGRLLAQVASEQEDLALGLLEAGLALAVVVPPNLHTARCHLAAEQRARAAGRGLWSEPGPVIAAEALGDRTGFRLIRGRIERRVRAPEGGANLQLEGGLVIRIRPSDARRSPELLTLSPGMEVQIRGWVSRRGDRSHIWLPHPANIAVQRPGTP